MTTCDEFVKAVQRDAQADTQADARLRYLFIDHAGAPGLMQMLQRWPSTQWTSLFEDSREAGALEVAPILVQLPRAGTSLGERDFLVWLHGTCRFSTSVSVLHSAWAHVHLASALKRRLDVTLPDKMPVMLRYFDTRTLDPFLQALTPERQGQFLGIASCWQWLDRAGNLREREAEQLTNDIWPRSLDLDVTQQNALIEAGEADALVAQMKAQAPDLCREEPTAELHALAERCVPRLGKLGIDDVRTQTLYCLTALQLGAEFDSQPAWADTLRRVAEKQISFEAALQEMGV